MTFVNDKSKLCTVDVENGITLYDVGGGAEGYRLFEMYFPQGVVKFSAEYEMKPINASEKYDLNWRVTHATIPQSFPLEKKVLWDVVAEALDVYGYFFHRKNANTISISISPKLT